jgi:CubicO group peptidase (beta-lactamase class C family)
LEAVFNAPLYKIAQQYLWEPMGASQDAIWLTDSKDFAIASAGFSATLRDWARLGLLIANNGMAQGKQIVSKSWIDECCHHGPKDQQVKFNVAMRGRGYRNFFWHLTPDGSVIRMAGAKGQFVVIDRRSKTVLVRTGVSDESGADEEMMGLFYQACKQK